MLGRGLERTQALGPEHFERRPQLSDGLRSRPIEPLGPVPPFGHKASVLEDAEVLRDRRSRDVETARDVADGELLARDEAKDLSASRFTKRGKWVDFSSVSAFLPSVKALTRPIVTDSRLNQDRSGCSPGTALARGFRFRRTGGGNGDGRDRSRSSPAADEALGTAPTSRAASFAPRFQERSATTRPHRHPPRGLDERANCWEHARGRVTTLPRLPHSVGNRFAGTP
jgi:hypothetical protein